jgi:hypothetical protein
MDQFGEYSKNQCGIQVKKLTPEDSGTWQCEVRFFLSYSNVTGGLIEKSHECLNLRKIFSVFVRKCGGRPPIIATYEEIFVIYS